MLTLFGWGQIRDARNTFQFPFHFPKFSKGGTIARVFPHGVRLQDFRREAPENGAEDPVLENFLRFSKKNVS